MEQFHNKELPYGQVSGHEAEKRVKSPADIENWQRSEAYYNIVGFINGISTAIQGIRISDDIHISDTMKKLLRIFEVLHLYVDQFPPIDQPQRFGNRAFRSWSHKMNHDIFTLLKDALPQSKCQFFNELGYYLSESFGNAVRIDYGTGHELSFVFFMCALFKAEILTEEDTVAAALRLFNQYLIFVRRLQSSYRMEPAGSQGVWSLDDFQFVPFIWGSAQLALNTPFDPSKFLDEEIINKYKDDYLFISCIDYISKVKTGHFAEHSNQLWSITAVPNWVKINTGLVRMYQKEILCKFPIIQHVLFGQLMPFERVKPGVAIPNARLGPIPVKSKSTSATVSRETLPPPEIKEEISKVVFTEVVEEQKLDEEKIDGDNLEEQKAEEENFAEEETEHERKSEVSFAEPKNSSDENGDDQKSKEPSSA